MPTDTERLDWLAKTHLEEAGVEFWECVDKSIGLCISSGVAHPERRYHAKDFRSVIDAAMLEA